MIKNIIFDLGGVLVGLDKQRCMTAFGEIGMGDIASFVSEHRCEDLFHDLEIGNIDAKDFCEEARRITSSQVGDGKIEWAWNEMLTDIPGFKQQKVLGLHKEYRVFLLSNTNPIHWDYCKALLENNGKHRVEDFFDRVFLSCDMHLSKPSAEIFVEVLSQAGLKADETLFVDDSQANCDAASSLGIHTMKIDINSDWTDEIDDFIK